MMGGRLLALLFLLSVAADAGCQAAEAGSAVPVYIKLEVEDFDGFGGYKAKGAVWSPRMADWLEANTLDRSANPKDWPLEFRELWSTIIHNWMEDNYPDATADVSQPED